MARKRRHPHRRGLRDLVRLWVDLFNEHELLTSATAIALRAVIAMVAIALLAIALLGETGNRDVWKKQIAPQIEPKVLPEVYRGIEATVNKVFSSSSAGLIAFATILAIWQVSGAVRACMSALSKIYGTKDERPWYVRFPLSIGIAIVVLAALVGAAFLIIGLKHAVHGSWGLPLSIARWLLTIALLTAAFGVLVRYAPEQSQSKKWASAGAALVVVTWIAQSLLFAFYVKDLGNYKTAVGSLLLVYVITTFAYVGSIVLMVGVELDEQLRRDLQGKDERGILEMAREVI